MTVDIYGLAQEIHTNAKDKGFWDTDRNLGEMLMLVVSELAEALEEHRDGKEVFYYAGGKPEGASVELADAAIRCLDTLYSTWNTDWGSMQEKYEEFCVLQSIPTRLWPDTENFGERLFVITKMVCKAYDNALWLLHVVVSCERLCDTLDHDIWNVARIKMNYNDTRPYRHGKAY